MGWLEFENLESAVTIGSIRLSMICLLAALVLRLCGRFPCEAASSTCHDRSVALDGARSLWLLGSFFSLLHALSAMGFNHHWSHTLAFEETARQTQSLLGLSVGVGIYFNYAFVAIWLADAFWWIGQPKSYLLRADWINWLVYGFLIFIAINGTIVFESGVVRWCSVGAVLTLTAIASRRLLRSNDAETQVESKP